MSLKVDFVNKDVKITVSKLSKLRPVISLLAIVFEWFLIGLSIFIHQQFQNPIVYFFVWIIISTRLYALYSLLHEAIHFLLLDNRRLNDIIARVFLAFPLAISLKEMRINHFKHHKHLQTEKDPEMHHSQYKEFQFPHEIKTFIFIFIKDLTGINFAFYRLKKLKQNVKYMFASTVSNAVKLKFITQLFLVSGLVMSLYFSGYLNFLILYWLVPYATLYQALNRLRLFTEHFNIQGRNAQQTRTVYAPFIEKFFLAPYNLGFHCEHHLYPYVPFYRLTQLHLLLKSDPDCRNKIFIDYGYKNVIKSCIKDLK